MTRGEARLFLVLTGLVLATWSCVALSWDQQDATASLVLYRTAKEYPVVPLIMGLEGGLAIGRLIPDRDWVDQTLVIAAVGALFHWFFPLVG